MTDWKEYPKEKPKESKAYKVYDAFTDSWAFFRYNKPKIYI